MAKAIWGKCIPRPYHYSERAIAKFTGVIDLARGVFRSEFATAIENVNGISLSYRFNCDDQILWALESNVPESEFLNETERVLMSVLLGAAETDYYYEFEKEW